MDWKTIILIGFPLVLAIGNIFASFSLSSVGYYWLSVNCALSAILCGFLSIIFISMIKGG